MAYTKVHEAWEDAPSAATPIDAEALDQIEAGIATAQSGVESTSSTVSAHVADTTNVHGITDTSALLDSDDIGVSVQAHSAVLDATTASFTTDDENKLDGIESGATADQTGAQIKVAYEGEANTNAYTDDEKSKLANIEATADVTDATNVAAAGAVMASAGIVVIDAGSNLSTARPTGAVVLWQFDNGTDPGTEGANVVNGVVGDLYFVASA